MSGGHQPRRLQRSRKRGARLPEGAIYVGRPTPLGNPFRSDRFGHARAVGLHRTWLTGRLSEPALRRLGFGDHERQALRRLRERALGRLPELAGRDLVCWCPLTSRWCHAETLIALANGVPA
jgi:hypothetical protein